MVARTTPDAPPAQVENDSGWTVSGELTLPGWLPGSIAYSPDGKMLVVGGSGGHVRAFDAATKKQLWDWTGDGLFAAVAFSPDGNQFGVTVKDGVQFLDPSDPTSAKAVHRLEKKGTAPFALGLFPDTTLDTPNGKLTSRKLIFGGEGGYTSKSWITISAVGTVNVDTAEPGRPSADPYAVPLAVDPGGNHAVITGPIDPDTGKNVLWACACGGSGGNHLLKGHKVTVTCAAWSADGSTVVTGDAGGVIIVWDAKRWKEKSRRGFDGRVCAVAVTADGRSVAAAVATSDQSTAITKNATDEKKGMTIVMTTTSAYFEQFYLWQTGDTDKKLTPLPVKNGRSLGDPFRGLTGLAFSPDGKELAAGFCNFQHLKNLGELKGTVRVWKLVDKDPPPTPASTWKEIPLSGPRSTDVGSVAFSPDGKTFVTGGYDEHVAVWDAATLKLRHAFPIKNAGPNRLTVAYRPDGKLIAVADPLNGVTLFDPEKGNDTRIDGQSSWSGVASGVAFSPDGNRLATFNQTRVRVIEINQRDTETVLDSPVNSRETFSGMAWSRDGQKLALISGMRRTNDNVTVWDTKTGGEVKRFPDRPAPPVLMAWSPDGKTLLDGYPSGQIRVWDGDTLQLKKTLTYPDLKVIVGHLRFSADSKTLAVDLPHIVNGEAVRPFGSTILFLDATKGDDYPERNRLFIEGEIVADLALSPDERTLVAVCSELPDSGRDRKKSRLRVWKRSGNEGATSGQLDGRLTLWVGNTFVHLKPDGTGVQTVEYPKDVLSSIGYGDGVRLAPDGKSFAVLRITKQLGGDGDMESKLGVVPLGGAGKATDMEGYVPRQFFSFDGQKVCFYGATGTVWDVDARGRAACYEYDSVTGLVTRMPIADHHYVHAGSADGKRMIYGGPVTTDDRTTWRTFVAGPGGKKSFEILGPNTFLGISALSPDGKRLVTMSAPFTAYKPGPGIGVMTGWKSGESILIDLESQVKTPVEGMPNEESLRQIRWNPAGTKIAYVHSRINVTEPGNLKARPGDALHDFKIIVADPDGSNAKVIYETTAGRFRDFIWK